jgi:hypothetical protein
MKQHDRGEMRRLDRPRAGPGPLAQEFGEVGDDWIVMLLAWIVWTEVVKDQVMQSRAIEIAVDSRLDPALQPALPIVGTTLIQPGLKISAEDGDEPLLEREKQLLL